MLNSTPIITCDHLFMLYVFLSVCIAITLKLFLIFLLVGRRGCCVLCCGNDTDSNMKSMSVTAVF